jgi:hypothetical protein
MGYGLWVMRSRDATASLTHHPSLITHHGFIITRK